MAIIWKLRGRVIEVGENETDSASEMKDGRHVTIHMRRVSALVVEDRTGHRHELPCCTYMGRAAEQRLSAGDEVEMLYTSPLPAQKKESFGLGRTTMVYGLRVVGRTEWMGADVADLVGKVRRISWCAGVALVLLSPIAALAGFMAGGLPGLYVLWLAIKAFRGAVKMSSASTVRAEIEKATRESQQEEALSFPASARQRQHPSPHDLLRV